jgi:WD40 repeat protein
MRLSHGRPALALALLLLPAAAGAADVLGDPLPAGAVARWGTIRLRQGHAIGALAFSPDGKTVASGAYDNDIYLWQADSGRERRHFTGHAGPVRALAFSHDGRTLASGSDDRTVRLWDVDGGKELRRLDGHTLSVLAVAFAPDGKALASAGSDYVVRVWDLGTGKERYRLQGHDSGVNAVAFSPDGGTLASGGDDNMVRLWDAASGKPLRKLAGHDDLVLSVAFSPDGKVVASGGKDGTLRLWQAADGTELWKTWAHGDGVLAAAFAAGGKALTTAGKDGQVARWDLSTGKPLGRFDSHHARLITMAVSPDGTRVAAGSEAGRIDLWDAATGKPLVLLPRTGDRLKSVAFTPDGRAFIVAAADAAGSIVLLDPASAKELRRFGAYRTTGLTLSPDGRLLALNGPRDGERLSLWNVATGKRLRDLPGHENVVSTDWLRQPAAFTPDGRFVIGPASRETLGVWDAGTGQEARTLSVVKDAPEPRCFAVAPDGRTAAVAYSTQNLRLWDADTGRLLRLCDGGELTLTRLAFSPDGRLLAGVGQGHVIRLWEVLTGQELPPLKEPDGAIKAVAVWHDNDTTAIAFGPDGRTVAAATDRSVRVWDLPTRREVRRFTGHQGWVNALSFAPDGKRLASASEDGTAVVWDTSRPRPAAAAELSAREVESRWADLGGDSATRAYEAIWALAAVPKQSVPLVARHVSPVPTLDVKRLARLFADLDDDSFEVREKATAELKRAAESVEEAVRKEMVRTTSEEVRQRLGQVLEAIDNTVALPGRRALPSRALVVLEQAGTPEARRALERLAEGAPGAWLTQEAKAALARLARQSAP